jgi:hypothetical protein
MSCLGVHFAISEQEMEQFFGLSGKPEALWDLMHRIEEKRDQENLQETGIAWDVIHRCLTGDNTPASVNISCGAYPLKKCVLGGIHIFPPNEAGDWDYLMCLVRPTEVRDVSTALVPLDKEWLRRRYFGLDWEAIGYEFGEDDFAYHWNTFEQLKTFFEKAAKNGRAVLFTASQ